MHVFDRSLPARIFAIGLVVLIGFFSQTTVANSHCLGHAEATLTDRCSQPISCPIASSSLGPAARQFDLAGYLERRGSPLLADVEPYRGVVCVCQHQPASRARAARGGWRTGNARLADAAAGGTARRRGRGAGHGPRRAILRALVPRMASALLDPYGLQSGPDRDASGRDSTVAVDPVRFFRHIRAPRYAQRDPRTGEVQSRRSVRRRGELR